MERDQETITTWENEQHNTAIKAMVAQPNATHSPEIAERKRLQDELRESEWRFRTMFEQAAIGIAFTALDGQLLEVNQRFCEIVGYTREELLQRTFRDITHSDDLAVNEDYLQRLIADNHPTPSIEKRYIHKDGRVVWVHLTVSLMRDPSNQPHSYMSVIEDITARKQVEEERALLLVREQSARAEAMEHASQLEAVIEAMTDGVFIYDAEARLMRANKTAREIFALDLQPDYSSRSVHDRVSQTEIRNEQGELIPEEQWPMLRIIRGEVFKGTDPLDVRIRALDGRDVRLSISGAPVRTAEGRILGGVLVVRDVTERRLLEKRTHDALQALLAIAEALVLAPNETVLADLSPSNTRTAVSKVAHRLAELTCDVLGCKRVGMSIVEPETEIVRAVAVVGLPPELERQWWVEQQQQESSLKDSSALELVAMLRANEVLIIDMTRPPFRDYPNPYDIRVMLMVPMNVGDSLVGLMSLDYGSEEHEYTPEDIALSKAIGRLAALVIERERLLHERAEARAGELALGEANRRMDEFLGVASHELRTPLTSIKGNVQLAKRRLWSLVQSRDPVGADVSGPAPIDRPTVEAEFSTRLEAIQGLLDRAERQLQLLNRLVGDLLDVSRIQANRLELRLEQCDLASIVREAVEDQQQMAPTRLIRLDLPTEKVYIIADSDAIGQVVTNYLSNALKYSAGDRPVEVTLSVEGQIARLSVRDDGPGLSDSEQEHVWERFYRVPGIEVQSGSREGLGLGLHISRTIIERHQGQVGIQSSPGQGSTFWFTLPLAQ